MPERHRTISVLQKITESGSKQYILSLIILYVRGVNTDLTFWNNKFSR